MKALESKELWELTGSEMVTLLHAIMLRLLDSYGVNEYQETVQKEVNDVLKVQMIHVRI